MNAEGICDDAHEEPTVWEVMVFEDDHTMDGHAEPGWRWGEGGGTRTHPDDPDLHYRVDSATQKVTLSAKLLEQLRRALGWPQKRINP